MITNGSVTIYHKDFDATTKLEIWSKFIYHNIWFYSSEGASVNNGYENANSFNCRIPYGINANLNIGNFAIGDIVVKGTLALAIDNQQDLDGYEVFNITSISNNTFGNNPHIHLGGR